MTHAQIGNTVVQRSIQTSVQSFVATVQRSL